MISDKQLEANRRNAQLSTGPKTAEGKARCAKNATRHGLTGHVNVMTEEDREAFDDVSERMTKDLNPQGEMEVQLALRIAKDTWRLNRASNVEDNIFAIGQIRNIEAMKTGDPEADAAFADARTFAQDVHQIQLLSLYEQRLNRGLQKNIALLRQIQTERKAQRAKEMAEAELLL